MRSVLLIFLAACGGAAVDPCLVPIAAQWGTARDDEALALVAARGGGAYVGGYTGGTLRLSDVGPVGDSRGYVRRIDARGAVQADIALDTEDTDVVDALAEAPDGRIYVAGRTRGAFPGAVQAGQFDAFTALLAQGSVAAVRQFGDERPQHPRRLALAGTRLLLAGFDDIYVPTNYVVDWENWFAAELSAADLSETWRIPSRTAWGDLASAVAVDEEGAIYVAGANTGGTQAGIWLRKLDAQGQQVWGSRLSSTALDSAAALVVRSDGTLLLAGTRAGGSQPVVFTIDRASGAPTATLVPPGNLTGTAAMDMTVDAQGNLYLAGLTSGAITPRYTNRGSYDPFVMRFDRSGTLTGSWQAGSEKDEEPTAIAIDSCGRVLIAGWTDGVIVPGAASAGGRDAFLLSVALQPE